MFQRECPHCHTVFTTSKSDKVYCRVRCRSDAENERRRADRARVAEMANRTMDDPWPRLGPVITENALLDGWTCADEAIAGPMACQSCTSALCQAKRRGVSDGKQEG